MSEQNQETHYMGKRMTALAWIMALLVLTMVFNNYLEKKNNPNRNLAISDHSAQQVTLKMNRAGHYLAPGFINGKKVSFLVDTGATDVAMPLAVARKLNLQLQAGGISQTASGIVHTYLTRLDSVRIGGIELNNVRASVIEEMPGDDVLLGMSFLKHLELIQKDRNLTLRL